jgi:hypothetical protein
MRRGRVSGVDGSQRADEFTIQNGADQVVEPDYQMRQVRLKFTQSEVHFGNRSSCQSHARVSDVEQAANTVVLILQTPARVIPLDGSGLGIGEVVPVSKKHRLNLLGERAPGMFSIPEVVSQGVEVRFFCRPRLWRYGDPESVTKGL